MKLVVRVRVVPDAVQASALERTLPAVNDAATWVSTVSFERFELKGSVRELRKVCHGELKARGFGAQAVHGRVFDDVGPVPFSMSVKAVTSWSSEASR
jgi:hypothetical protein